MTCVQYLCSDIYTPAEFTFLFACEFVYLSLCFPVCLLFSSLLSLYDLHSLPASSSVFVYLSVYLLISLRILLFLSDQLSLFVGLSIYLFACLLNYFHFLSVWPAMFVCKSVYLSVYLSVRLPVCTARPGSSRQPTHTHGRSHLGLPCTVTFPHHYTWSALFAHLSIHTFAHSGSLSGGFFYSIYNFDFAALVLTDSRVAAGISFVWDTYPGFFRGLSLILFVKVWFCSLGCNDSRVDVSSVLVLTS